MQVSGTMTEGVICVTRSTTMQEAWQIMQDVGVHHLPVFDSGKVQGIVSDRDFKLAAATQKPLKDLLVREFMSSPVEIVSPEADVMTVLSIMLEKRISSVVVGEENDLHGIITTFDMMVVLKNILHANENEKAPIIDEISLKLGLGRVADFLSQAGI